MAIKGVGCLGEFVKKENLWQKSFSDNAEWTSKKLLKKMMSADIKADPKQEIKELVAVSSQK